MPRKPISEYAGGKGPRQHIWEAIRALAAISDDAFDEHAIWRTMPRAARAGIPLATVRDYRHCLQAAGILVLVTATVARRTPATYRLARNEGIDAPRVRRDGTRVTQGLAQEQMWRTLRLISADTNARELAAHASTPDNPVAEVAAMHYLQMLNNAGYLDCTREGKGTGNGGIQARYRLKPGRNTGPRPPMVCRTRVVYDPNEGKVVWARAVSEEDAIYGH